MSNPLSPLSPTHDASAPFPDMNGGSSNGSASGVNGASRGGLNANGMPVPAAPHNRTASAPFNTMQQQREYNNMGAAFTGPRSPPKAKNTSHVPCKFYPYGTCQAGAACQFSHDLDPMTQNAPCKYFAKGSCKFGQGCALAHILPDGRVINRPPRGQTFAYARRSHIPHALPPGPPSLLSMQAHDLSAAQQDLSYQTSTADDPLDPRYHQHPTLALSSHDGPQGSADPSVTFSSPPHDSRLPASPTNRGLSVLDAPLPSSFDSQGISLAARHGPFAASLPHRFGIESPPSSLPNKPFASNLKFRGLQGSTFGDPANLDGVLHGMGSSPPSFDEPLSFSKRPLHSERLHSERLAARPRMGMMSASLGTRPSLFQPDHSSSDLDESDDDGIGEDLLPSSLHELLPQEKLRRFSRNIGDDDTNPSFLSAGRRAISNGNTPQDSKVGSLSPHSASPSRYNALFTSRSLSKADSDSNGASAFGHVGSPLRPSALRSSSLANVSSTGDVSPHAIGSPPRQASMSMLTQELQRTQINDQNRSLGVSSRPMSMTSNPARNSLAERGMSSSSLGRETIEEEQGLFSMEEEDVDPPMHAKNTRNPVYGIMPGKSEPTLGPIGTK
ncbi:hypothetical protein AAFC00_005362 [Neodothiora populina]|uniref:C3H1-type domain-containing protein n=1 Tax=Neodothiora populina TaxID=2781224 RepID=A0ABR3PKM9_9PEZI